MVKQFRSMTYPYVAWISVMIVLPMLLIVLYAFTVSGNEVLTFQFTFDNFKRFVTDTVFMEVLGRSLYIAVLTTLICIALGYPIAYAIAQMNSRSNTIMILLITMPTWVNMLVRTYAWMGILQDEGILNTILGFFGIGPVSMIHTSFAVILGMVYNFIPFMILQIHTSLAKMDKSLLEAANDLGATPVQAFLRVTLPLSLPGVPHLRRLELRQRYFPHHGDHHHAFDVAHAQGRRAARQPRKGVTDDEKENLCRLQGHSHADAAVLLPPHSLYHRLFVQRFPLAHEVRRLLSALV